MTSKRYFQLLLSLLVILIGLIGAGIYYGNVLLKKEADKLTALKVENEVIENQQTSLLQAKKDVERYIELNEIAKSIVPQDKDQARTVREIVSIAEQSGVRIKSVTFENSTLGQAPVAAAPASGGSGAAAPKPPASQLKPVEGINGVFALPIQVESLNETSYNNFIRFLEGLEKNRRTSHVNKVDVSPKDGDGSQVKFTLTVNAYVKP